MEPETAPTPGTMQVYFVLDDQGQPLIEDNVELWSQWFENADRSVGRTVVTPDVFVLTVFSGVAVVEADKAPLLFTTHVYGGVFNNTEARWATRGEAIAKHAETVEWCRIASLPSFGIEEKDISVQ